MSPDRRPLARAPLGQTAADNQVPARIAASIWGRKRLVMLEFCVHHGAIGLHGGKEALNNSGGNAAPPDAAQARDIGMAGSDPGDHIGSAIRALFVDENKLPAHVANPGTDLLNQPTDVRALAECSRNRK
jgi:hypothetical protein